MSVAIIVPLYNSAQVLEKTLESVLQQDCSFDELIIINDASTDGSFEVATDFIEKNKEQLKNIKTTFFSNTKNKGLAYGYNKGIHLAKSDLLVFMHDDVVAEKNALGKLIKPFFQDPGVVASYGYSLQSYKVWDTYNFWQKYFFCRWVGKKIAGMNGKFDCIRKSALLKIGCFDWKTFRVAGEDGDIILRLRKVGKIVATRAEITHLHDVSPDFGIKQLIRKQAQLSEAQGALYKKHGFCFGIKGFIAAFFREALFFMLIIPYLRIFSLVLISFYSILISKAMFLKEYKNPRVLAVPFLNILMIPVSTYASIKGFITGKQTL